MRLQPKIELVVEADEPVLFFSSVNAAEEYMEAVDVQGGVYRSAYDIEGNPFSIALVDGEVCIRRIDNEPRNEDVVKMLVSDFLREIGIRTSGREKITELLERCLHYITY